MKFQRNYRITIEEPPDTLVTDLNTGEQETAQLGQKTALVIEPPLTIQFSIQTNTLATLNSLQLIIYNLSEDTRNKIFQDRFNILNYVQGKAYPQPRRIIFEAGYGDDLSIIFSGHIFEANSARQGSNIITTISSRDGGFDTPNTFTSRTVAGGTPIREIITGLIGDFPLLNQGTIGDIEGTVKRPVVLNGNTFNLLKSYSNGSAFIDLENVNVLQNNEYIESQVITVFNGDTGLIETPRRDDAYLTITTLLEPKVSIGNIAQIESTILPIYDGRYKVIGVNHQGIISEAVGGACYSTFNLLLENQLFGRFKGVANQNN